eukprot:CAMPEP_0113847366 /NCGR_PEP_ID=MMETSP0372-20130328/1833_1 /TAXON_ID=340204 /ORGANISM="Lankesteria abbotti" /LENGTH=188 /DNA_ID=CAMNT_0000816633 /DNA_START=63 /DNA_END=629 /DNA_ORIENTATION=+ /assembly_acc=CAM_ASM_000359
MVHYCREVETHTKTCKAKGADLRVSFKNTFSTAHVLRGMNLPEAQKYLQDVIDKKRCVPFFRYATGLGRCAQAKEFNAVRGRWPKKSCKFLLDLLKNAEATAEFKNLEADQMFIWHIAVQRAQHGRRRTYRAHGRINAFMSHPCHVEVILKEKAEQVPRPKADGGHNVTSLTRKQLARRPLAVGGGVN